MNLNCKLVKKTFKTDDGREHDYYVLLFDLADGSTLELSVKGNNAKLLVMSYNLTNRK